jgi:hypothetical protein
VRRRTAERKSSAAEHVSALPWAAIAQAVMLIAQRWRSLSEKDRARLRKLVADSQGRAGNLSVKQRLELRALVRKLDLKGLVGELAPLARGGRGRGRGRRCRCCRCCRRARA